MSRQQLQKIFSSPLFIGVVMFLFLMGLTQYLSYERYLLLKEDEADELDTEASAARARLQTVLSSTWSTAQTLGFIVDKYGVPNDFDSVAARLLKANKYVDVVQLVQGSTITHVYPLKGNEVVIGYSVFSDSIRNTGAYTAIKSGAFFWAGPVPLKQGGVGIIGRQPLYKNDTFFGFAAVIIHLNTFLQGAGIDPSRVSVFSYQLSRVDPVKHSEEFFLTGGQPTKDAYSVPIQISNGEWKLYVTRKSGPTLYITATFSLLGLLLSITGGLFAWFMARQPARLNQLVNEKTSLLASSEQYYKALIEKSSDAIVLMDRSGRIMYQSPSTTLISGYAATELHGVDSAALIHPEDRKMDSVFFDAFREQPGASTTRMHRFRHKSGNYIWIEGTYTNLLHEKSVNAIVFNYHDISGRIAAQQEILREKNLSESIINSLPGVFYLYDSKGRFMKWNKNFEVISGYSAEEIQQIHPLDFFEGSEKDLLATKIAAVFTTGSSEIEAPFVTKDGSKLDYFFNGHLTHFNGEDYLIGMGIDITERKKAEKEIITERNLSASIINSLPGIFYLADFNGRLLRWNKNFETVSGYSAGEIKNMRVIQFVHTDEHSELLHKKEVAIKQGVSDVEANFLSKQNQKFPYQFTSLLSTYNGQPCLLGVGIDITDRKKAQDALLKRTNELNERVKELNCLYRVSEISYNRELSTAQITTQCLEVLASSYQYPEVVCICINFDGNNFCSEKFKETIWKQRADIIIQGKVVGSITAYYMEERPVAEEGPFLKEERWLLNSVARVISTATERKLADEEIRKSQVDLRQLSAHLQTVREEERTSISREIHDELGQQLTGLKMDVSWLKKVTADTIIVDKLQSMIALIDDTIKTVRRISSDLRPGILDDLGLPAALEWQSNEFEKRTGIKSDFKATDLPFDFKREVATGVFRIYQESLTNVTRHANATQVNTTIEQRANEIVLTINDNGDGFDAANVDRKKTLGLLGMRERALMFNGKLTINSERKKGTIITLVVPFEGQKN